MRLDKCDVYTAKEREGQRKIIKEKHKTENFFNALQ